MSALWAASGFKTSIVTVVSPVSDVCDRLVTMRHSEGLGDGFVEPRGGQVECVRSLVQIMDVQITDVQIMDSDGAGFEGHECNLTIFAICSLSWSR
jgi:hypothetical protein